MTAPLDPEQELALLAGAVRAYAEQLRGTGVLGLPRELELPEGRPASEEGGAAVAATALLRQRESELSEYGPPIGPSSRHEASPQEEVEPSKRPAQPSREPTRGAAAHKHDGPRAAERASTAAPTPKPPSGSKRASAPRRNPMAEPAAAPPPPVPSEPKLASLSPLVDVGGPRGLDNDAVRKTLEVLQAEVAACTRCGLAEGRTNSVFARGRGTGGLCFVGEGPGADEDAQGEPFVGKAGQLLDKMVAAMGFDRDDIYVCNIVKCRPPNNRKPEPAETAACVGYLHTQLEQMRPDVIVALGATAVQGLLGVGGGITRMRGKWKLYRGQIPVMPTFHPAYLLRKPTAKREVWEDLQSVLTHMGRSAPGK